MMISLICIAASVLFTAAVIAAREGRYEAALVCLVLFVFNTVLAVLKEQKIKKRDTERHLNISELCNEMASLLEELYWQ